LRLLRRWGSGIPGAASGPGLALGLTDLRALVFSMVVSR